MERNREYLLNLRTRVSQAMAKRFEEWQIAAALLNGRLQALSPLATLGRGYAIALKLPQLQAVKGIGRLSPGDRLRLIFADGCGEATLESVRPGTPGQPADNGSS
jgi:exodeoxyribonuclease VII large subunit